MLDSRTAAGLPGEVIESGTATPANPLAACLPDSRFAVRERQPPLFASAFNISSKRLVIIQVTIGPSTSAAPAAIHRTRAIQSMVRCCRSTRSDNALTAFSRALTAFLQTPDAFLDLHDRLQGKTVIRPHSTRGLERRAARVPGTSLPPTAGVRLSHLDPPIAFARSIPCIQGMPTGIIADGHDDPLSPLSATVRIDRFCKIWVVDFAETSHWLSAIRRTSSGKRRVSSSPNSSLASLVATRKMVICRRYRLRRSRGASSGGAAMPASEFRHALVSHHHHRQVSPAPTPFIRQLAHGGSDRQSAGTPSRRILRASSGPSTREDVAHTRPPCQPASRPLQ